MLKMKMFSVLLFFLSVLQFSHSSPSYYSDQQALLSFKDSISLDPFNSLQDWSPNHNTCNWTGVTCSTRRPRVVSLNLTGMSLVGTISSFIGNLSFLGLLDLSFNSFHGVIPYQLGSLLRLWRLRLTKNELEGSIPPTLGGCRSLQRLTLSYNHLSGTIPSQLGLLSQLKIIYLGENQLTGTIPSSIGNLSSLTDLQLGRNRLHGSIPVELGMLTQLTRLHLHTNNFTGPIPTALSNCTRLQNLWLYNNRLTGRIPFELGTLTQLQNLSISTNNLTGPIPTTLSNCTHLQMLSLYENQLTGPIPSQFGKLSELQILLLELNQFSGEIPSSLSNCSLLELVDLGGNQLNGTMPLEFGKLLNLRRLHASDNHRISGSSDLSILTALTNCSYLEDIVLFNNFLTGVLPSSITQLSSLLSYLELSSNKIEGKIPSGIGNLTKLAYLGLYDNRFNGSIPSTLSQLPNLERLDLEKNNLSGTIPKSLGDAKRLGSLSLGKNMLSGEIPDSLGNLPQLRALLLNPNQLSGKIPGNLGRCITLERVDLSYNKLRGNIPPEFAGLQNVHFYFNISSNLLQGSILVLSKMVKVQAIDVSHNHFTGEIPAALSSCTDLQYLNLSWNAFEGRIPALLTNLKNVQDIDLSKNNLSGTIPIGFKEMKMLHHINLSSNRLTGEVPMGGVFATVGESAIMGNPGICGTWINLQPCTYSKHKQLSRKVIIPLVIAIAVFIMSFLVFYHRRHIRHINQSIPTLNVGHTRILYEELVDATSGFSHTNIIGTGSFGSVYKGILKNGINIAVKVFNLQDENNHQSFDKECSVLKRVRHRNVIRIISTCSNLDFDFKALVLPLMSNGNLERWLYPQGANECRLNLADRIRLALEIAHGITYLHHHCFVQVIHCDLKPNNVLLGDDMTPYIADFGIAKLVLGSSTDSLTSTNALKGSIGYIAPEYGMGGNISTKGDVYSYGILLLELLTRKRPTDDMFAEGINLQKWVGIDFPNKIIEVVDNNLLKDVNESDTSMVLACLTQLIEIGMVCTRELPQQRPDMEDIVERLEKIKAKFHGTLRDFQFLIDISSLLERRNGIVNSNLGIHEDFSTSTS